MKEAIQEAIQTKGICEMEHQMQRADGTFDRTFSRAIPLLDANGEVRHFEAVETVRIYLFSTGDVRHPPWRTARGSNDEAGRIAISAANTGMGIRGEALPNIFQGL